MKKTAPAHYRQGDILLIKTTAIPAEATPVKPRMGNRLVVAEGEATGHHHSFAAGSCALLEHGPDLYLDVPEGGAALEHQEHDTILVDAGVYHGIRQSEWIDEETIQQVAD